MARDWRGTDLSDSTLIRKDVFDCGNDCGNPVTVTYYRYGRLAERSRVIFSDMPKFRLDGQPLCQDCIKRLYGGLNEAK